MSEQCGCRIETNGDKERVFGKELKIAYCPLHRAADKLLEALRNCLCQTCGHRFGWTEPHGPRDSQNMRSDWAKCSTCKLPRAAIALAEGESVKAGK